MKLTNVFLTLLLSLFVANLNAQQNVRDSIISTPWVAVNYGGMFTGADLADRYGFINHLGVMAGYKTTKNWVWSLDGNFMFGNQIRVDDPLANLRDSKGFITDQNGSPADAFLFSRGFNVNAVIGKVVPVLSPNKNSGLFFKFGAGYMMHKIRVETNNHVVPLIELDYKKGYDRLTGGLNLSQFAGYALMANRGYLNFYAGFYIQEGFTKNYRTIFFDQPDVPVSQDIRLDIQYGFKVGWFIPIYKRLPKEFYYD